MSDFYPDETWGGRLQRWRTEAMHWSQQELVDHIVNDAYKNKEDRGTRVDTRLISKWENGDVQRPQAIYQRILQRLGAPLPPTKHRTAASLPGKRPQEAAAEFIFDEETDSNDQNKDGEPPVFRREFVLLGTGMTMAIAALLEGAEPTAVPTHVGGTEIEQIHTAAGVFTGWDHTYGGGLVREAVLAQLRFSASLLEATYPEDLSNPLHSAVGYLAHTCGFMAFDAYAHDDARRAFRFALACAEEAEDWQLRAKILSSMARQAIWVGQPDKGLTLAEHALVRADRLTATERAMLHTARARALAKMGRAQDTMVAIDTADNQFAHSRPANDPPWMGYYDAAQHAGDTGHALFDLAIHGHSSAEASTRLAFAVAGHTATFARSRAISQIKLASLTMATGDPHEAAAIGSAALEAAGTIRSRRAADDLRELALHSLRHQKIAEVGALQHHINTLVMTT